MPPDWDLRLEIAFLNLKLTLLAFHFMYIKSCPHGLKKALDTQERTGNLGRLSHEILRLLSRFKKGYVDKALNLKRFIF